MVGVVGAAAYVRFFIVSIIQVLLVVVLNELVVSLM